MTGEPVLWRIRLAAVLVLSSAAPLGAQATLGAFSVQEGREPLTNRSVVAIGTPSHEDGPNVSLMWRCTPEPDVVLSFLRMQVLGSDPKSPGRIPVHWWFDGGAEREASWLVASGGQRLALPESERAAFTEVARKSEQLFVRFEGSPGGRPTYTFDLAGVNEALERVPCHSRR